MLRGIEGKVEFEFERTFMFYLPRICEYCPDPACTASCPSGIIYGRAEDGIILVDQDRRRGWCIYTSGCPYRKVYFNRHTGKTEECTFYYPRVELGIPMICAETYVGQLRYVGLILYDADAVLIVAAEHDKHKLYEKQLTVFLDPKDLEIRAEAKRQGIPHDWVEVARRSPVKKLVMDHRMTLPLHPGYRTMLIVWYIPPLSLIVDPAASAGHDAEDVDNLFGAIDVPHIPMEYLANLFTVGGTTPVRAALEKMAVIRSYMRGISLGEVGNEGITAKIGMTGQEAQDMFRLLTIARHDERYVIPPSYKEQVYSLGSISTGRLVGEGGTAPDNGSVTVTIGSYSATKVRWKTAQEQGTFLD